MTKSLLIRLVLPLISLFTVTFILSRIWPQEEIFINLSTEIIGILITVSYVAWILRRHEKQKWESTDLKISNRLKILLNSTVSSIRSGLDIGVDILPDHLLKSTNLDDMHRDIITISENVIYPMIPQCVRRLDARGWRSLVTQVANAHNGVITFFNAFHSRLRPEQIAIILDLQEALSSSLIFYTITPELADISHSGLPGLKNERAKEWRQSGLRSTINQL